MTRGLLFIVTFLLVVAAFRVFEPRQGPTTRQGIFHGSQVHLFDSFTVREGPRRSLTGVAYLDEVPMVCTDLVADGFTGAARAGAGAQLPTERGWAQAVVDHGFIVVPGEGWFLPDPDCRVDVGWVDLSQEVSR